MSSNKITIELEDRKETRKEVRALRAEGVLPGVINEPNVDSKNVAVTLREFKKVYDVAGRTQPIEFGLSGKKHLGMIKEIDRDPVLGELIHFTIQSIKADEVVTAEIPVRLDEEVEVPAKKVGFDVIAVTHSFEVEALPHQIPEEFLIDPSKLTEIGDRILVSDAIMPEGVKLKTEEDGEQVLYIVEAPRVTSEEDLASDEGDDGSAADVPSEKGDGGDSDDAGGDSSSDKDSTKE
jgi:large subunit ribosomal protein L25